MMKSTGGVLGINSAGNHSWTRSWFDAAGQMRAFQQTAYVSAGVRTTIQEYNYDALGRRVLLRTRRDSITCGGGDKNADPECIEPIERFFWDGDQILYETRRTGGFQHDNDTGWLNALTDALPYFGMVRYTHAVGIDEPQVIWKFDGGARAVVPTKSWRGFYEGGKYLTTGNSADSLGWPGTARDIYMNPDTRWRPPQVLYWMGSLSDSKADISGLTYMRNRYYDARSGQFTQPDPIGLAGGLNQFGYVGGDPVNSRDPFGLSPTDIIVQGENSRKIVDYLYENSATFREAYDRLNYDHSVQLTIRDAQGPFEFNGFAPGAGKSGTITFNDVNLNQANYNLMQADPKADWMFTGASVMGHEMGHANAWLGNGSAGCRMDSPPGCILRFENKVRRDLPASERGGFRPRYSFTPGQPR